MQKVIPVFHITDYSKSLAFYVDNLGFEVDWQHVFEAGFPVFAQITKEDMTIYLSEHKEDCAVGGLIYLFVNDVDTWYNELKINKNIVISNPPNEDIEGLRTMTILDPDLNQLRICTRV